MNTLHWRLPRLMALALLAALPVRAARADDTAALARAREVLRMLVDGKYEEFFEAGDEQVQKGLPAEKAKEVWTKTQEQCGPYQGEIEAKVETKDGQSMVTLASRFERINLDIVVVLDDQERVAGFWLRPSASGAEYEPPDYVDRAKFSEQQATVSAGTYPLPGTLTVPTGDRPRSGFPGVVLVHGSGPHDQDETVFAHKPFRDLAWGLASKGVAVLRYEKRTHKHPGAHPADTITLDDETIDDAVAAARILREQPDVDPRRVFVLGHSLGAVGAPFAARKDSELAGIILLAGCARPLTDVVENQIEYLAAVDGEVTPQERKQIDEAKQALSQVRDGKLDGDPVLGLPSRYLHMLGDYDPVAAARTLDLPILIAQGGRDYQINMKDWRLWRKGLAGRPNVTFKLFESCNHLFVAGEGPSSPEEYMTAGHVDGVVVDYLADWVKSARANR